jgi:hypothetical protein
MSGENGVTGLANFVFAMVQIGKTFRLEIFLTND